MDGLYFGCCSVLFFYLACVEQWGRTGILAQASSSRLGENSRSSHRVLPRALAQATSFVLSDTLSRSGEKVLPKQEFVKSPKAIVGSLA